MAGKAAADPDGCPDSKAGSVSGRVTFVTDVSLRFVKHFIKLNYLPLYYIYFVFHQRVFVHQSRCTNEQKNATQ